MQYAIVFRTLSLKGRGVCVNGEEGEGWVGVNREEGEGWACVKGRGGWV